MFLDESGVSGPRKSLESTASLNTRNPLLPWQQCPAAPPRSLFEVPLSLAASPDSGSFWGLGVGYGCLHWPGLRVN